MNGIYLTKDEKRMIMLLAAGHYGIPSDFPSDRYAVAAARLRTLGLVKCKFLTNGSAAYVRLSSLGKSYLLANPKLANPVNWSKVAAIAAVISLLISIVVAVIGCSIIIR